MSQGKVFVTGATGTQGGALVRHLLRNNFAVNSVTRDINSDSSRILHDLGVTLFPGDWDNNDALADAIKGCRFLFLNSAPSFTDPKAELRNGLNILKAAQLSGVEHIIHSSAIRVNHPEEHVDLPKESFIANYFRSKHTLENEVLSEKWAPSWTIIRGVYFMTNFLAPAANFMFPELVDTGTLVTAFLPQSKVLLLNPDDIGRFAVAVFQQTKRFDKKEIDLAAEALSVEEIAEKMGQVAEKEVKVIFYTEEQVKNLENLNPIVKSQVLLRNMQSWVDLVSVREWGVTLQTFEEFLLDNKDRVKNTIRHCLV